MYSSSIASPGAASLGSARADLALGQILIDRVDGTDWKMGDGTRLVNGTTSSKLVLVNR